jgi:hypothetical protein
MSTQSPAEKARLNAAWKAQPEVIALTAAVDAFIAEGFDPTTTLLDRVNATVAFSNAWIKEHGHLPDSGLICN